MVFVVLHSHFVRARVIQGPHADSFLFGTFLSFQVAPWTKLPAFYLLDCISKNTYEPYARTFSVFIVPLFLEAYDQVDPSTRRKMEEMLLTWRTGAPGAKELFGVSSQVAIERTIWGGSGNNPLVRPCYLAPVYPLADCDV
jgi:hypothetical protein